MNKKHFLLLLPVCLVICLSFITCEEEEEAVHGLWEKLRNTAWISGSGSEYTIGFYGPMNGPYRNSADDSPYIVIRKNISLLPPSGEELQWGETRGIYIFSLFRNIKIDRTGKEISGGNRHFNINFESDGKLTIDNVTYSKISSNPNYDWNEITPDAVEIFLDRYRAYYQVSPGSFNSRIITENIWIDKTYFRIEDDDHAYFNFEISDWKLVSTPKEYESDYPCGFKLTGKIISAYPQQGGDNPALYGNKTAPGFSPDDINSTECWMYLYFDIDGEVVIRTAFSKADKLNEYIITESNNTPRIYRRYD